MNGGKLLPEMNQYKHLLGREFKRNKYGLSDWTQRVTRVIEIAGVIKIYGDGKSLYPYRIDEIQFIDQRILDNFNRV